MCGKLYGVGTGPGNPEDITVKALRVIRNCDVVVFPGVEKESCYAYRIIKEVFEGIEEKELLFFDFPMTRDESLINSCRNKVSAAISDNLKLGKNVAFLTIGDPTVYSTYFYIQSLVQEAGYETEIVNGVTSFCAVAGRLGISLSEREQEIHIIPASYDIKRALSLNGTLVFMKAGKKLFELKQLLLQRDEFEVKAVSNCGMENEKVYEGIDELDENSGYLTVVIVKRKQIQQASEKKNYSFFQNTACENFPCHKTSSPQNFNCLFCYCPLYALGEKCGGNFTIKENGIKSCINCDFPHKKENYEKVNARFSEIADLMKRNQKR